MNSSKVNKQKISNRITLISFISAGTLAMLRSEQNDTKTKIAATLVCSVRDSKIKSYSLWVYLELLMYETINYKRYQLKDKMQLSRADSPQQKTENAPSQKIQYQYTALAACKESDEASNISIP